MHHVLQANISAMTQNDTSHSEQPASQLPIHMGQLHIFSNLFFKHL